VFLRLREKRDGKNGRRKWKEKIEGENRGRK
jgi:hypothetical protein